MEKLVQKCKIRSVKDARHYKRVTGVMKCLYATGVALAIWSPACNITYKINK